MRVKILVDNQAKQGFKSEWGFSCLVEAKEKVLFDTGASSAVLSFNAERFGIKPREIDKLVLSHDHWDHNGGLDWALQNSGLKVFVLDSFSNETKERIRGKAELVEVGEEAVEISRGIRSTGKLSNSMDEQSLAVETGKGLLVVTGCSHPGLEKILEKAKRFGKIHAVIGGFHGFEKFDALHGIELIAATHCTEQKQKIKELFPQQFVECAAGVEFDFSSFAGYGEWWLKQFGNDPIWGNPNRVKRNERKTG